MDKCWTVVRSGRRCVANAHNLAKVSLARAMGLAEEGVKKFIEVK